MSTAIEISSETLREMVAAQILTKFDDPNLMANVIREIMTTKVDNYGHFSPNGSRSAMQWSVEKTIKEFISEVTKEWIEEHQAELRAIISTELTNNVVKRLAKETAERVGIK